MTPRRPRWVYGVGEDPDPRFSLANERTLLAWIRTALALAAGGLALLFAESLLGDWTSVLAAAVFGTSLAVALGSLLRWASTERALRTGGELPAPWQAIVVVAALALGTLAGAVLAAVSG